MAKSVENTFINFSGAFPSAAAVNASGAGATDGTEFVKAYLDNWAFGPQQALLDRAGLTPDEVTESATASQVVEAIKKGFNTGPGKVEMYHFNDTFATLGYRILSLNGQGVLRATYPELDAICYVGDGNNATVAAGGGAYYRADDAAGVTPNIAGIYLILPESRGYAPRGLDTAASIDPGGATRFLGDNQGDTLQGFEVDVKTDIGNLNVAANAFTAGGTSTAATVLGTGDDIIGVIQSDGVNGTPRISSETRMTNFSVNYGVGY
jgi:hypothetical protein